MLIFRGGGGLGIEIGEIIILGEYEPVAGNRDVNLVGLRQRFWVF